MEALLKLFSLKLIASLFGVLYSILQVRYFGASRIVEVFFAAQSLVYLVTSLAQGGQLSEVFLPEYHRLNLISKGLGFKALNIVINRMFFLATILSIPIFFLAPIFIDVLVPGFSEGDKKMAVLIFRILLPCLYFQLFNLFFATVLNAEEKFEKAEVLGFTNVIINLICIITLYQYIGIWALVTSLLLGKFLEFVFYISQLYKIKYRYHFILRSEEFDHADFFKTIRSTFLYVGATQIYSIVLTASISFLPEGVYAIFRYVQNLANRIKGLFIQPFITIFFTKYSQLLQDSKSLLNEFIKNIQGILKVNTIVIVVVILLGISVLNFLWGSNKFDASDVSSAQVFLVFNSIGILFSGVGSLYRKMAISHGKGKVLYRYWSVSQLLSALLSFFLIKYFDINGLLFIIPLNIFLISIVSYTVYIRTKNSFKFYFLNKENIESLILIALAAAINFILGKFSTSFNNSYQLIFLMFVTLVLCLKPLYSLYRLFNSKNTL